MHGGAGCVGVLLNRCARLCWRRAVGIESDCDVTGLLQDRTILQFQLRAMPGCAPRARGYL